MRTITFYFQVHQPFRLRRYRFFDIGNDHYYYDDFSNKSIMRRVAKKCYLPANQVMLDLIEKHKGKFKVSYCISGMAMEQFERYAPEVVESFRRLVATGQVELLTETYSHSLASLRDADEFKAQVLRHTDKIEQLFGVRPTVFRNTEFIYSDHIGHMVAQMGFKAMLTEGAKHVLGWKSPNYLYHHPAHPGMKILLRNFKLSDDIAFRFSNVRWTDYPLTAEKFSQWLKDIPQAEENVNLFMDYETIGEHQWAETGIFEFLKALPEVVLNSTDYGFATPSEAVEAYGSKDALNVPYPISWADEERDLSAWVGNELQNEAFNKLYQLIDQVRKYADPSLLEDWSKLQTSDHFYYMCTKFFTDGDVHKYFNHYDTPYDAFINYMNVLSDFTERLQQATRERQESPEHATGEELEQLIAHFRETLAKLEERKALEQHGRAAEAIERAMPQAEAAHQDNQAKPKAQKAKEADAPKKGEKSKKGK